MHFMSSRQLTARALQEGRVEAEARRGRLWAGRRQQAAAPTRAAHTSLPRAPGIHPAQDLAQQQLQQVGGQRKDGSKEQLGHRCALVCGVIVAQRRGAEEGQARDQQPRQRAADLQQRQGGHGAGRAAGAASRARVCAKTTEARPTGRPEGLIRDRGMARMQCASDPSEMEPTERCGACAAAAAYVGHSAPPPPPTMRLIRPSPISAFALQSSLASL